MAFPIPIIDAVLGIADTLIKRAWPDPAEQAKAQAVIMEIMQRADLAQIEVNKVEAASSSLFVSGWRPSVGWVCSAALAWQYIGQPVALFAANMAGMTLLPLPKMDLSDLLVLLGALLGYTGLRTWEKGKGIAS